MAFIGNTIFTSVFSEYGIGLKLPVSTVATVLEKGELLAVLHSSPTLTIFYSNFMEMIFNRFNWVS